VKLELLLVVEDEEAQVWLRWSEESESDEEEEA
jgi:hypothetical protein